MPDYDAHIKKYKHNRNFVRFGINQSREKFDDWEIVGDFYACIHLIEAILYKEYLLNPINHDDRLSKMTDHPDTFNHTICTK